MIQSYRYYTHKTTYKHLWFLVVKCSFVRNALFLKFLGTRRNEGLKLMNHLTTGGTAGSLKARPHDERDNGSKKTITANRYGAAVEQGRDSNHRQETVRKLAPQAGQP